MIIWYYKNAFVQTMMNSHESHALFSNSSRSLPD